MKKNTEILEKFRKFDGRLRACQILTFFICFAIIAWLFLIMVVDVKNYKLKAKKQRNAQSFIMRGEIFDRNGEKLASDATSFNVYAHPGDYLHSPAELAKILSPVLNIPEPKLTQMLSGNQRIILLKKDADRQTAVNVRKLQLREVSLDKKNERVYPQGRMAAHVLGYYDPDADITAGVENTANNQLEDAENPATFELTPSGDIIYNLTTNLEATIVPVKGKPLTLTLNNGIQHVCETELKKMIEDRHALRGAIIVIQPKTGEILAYSVYPDYDPNNFKAATPLEKKNWTLTDVYPPGSTFKVLTLSAGIESGKINENTKIEDTGTMKIGGWTLANYDVKKFPHPGIIDLYHLLEHSSNVGSAKIALMMDKQEYYNILKRFGVGSKTGIDLPSESSGLLPDYRGWGEAEQASMGYGYGASTTFIQMATFMAALANGGVRITPHVIKYSDEEKAKKITETPIMSPETAKTVTKLLAGSIGRSKVPVNLDDFNVAAKTGTSLKPNEGGKGYTNQMYTSVMGFFPAFDPQVMIYVVIDSAQGAEVWGNTVASPVFREVALQIARILNIQPDKVKPTAKT